MDSPVSDEDRGVDVHELGDEVVAIAADAPEGEALDPITAALIAFAVRACGTTIDRAGTRSSLGAALDAGATPQQAQEALVLIAGIGIHGLIGTADIVADVLRGRGDPAFGDDLDAEQQAVFDRVGGNDPREQRIAGVAPDFLPNLVRLSPEAVVRDIMTFRAAPWKGDSLTNLQRELIGIAVDSAPGHRFLPTLRMHVRRAIELGAGRRQIASVLEIAAAAPAHRGVR